MAELRVKSTGTLKLFENDNTSSVTIASPASLGADRTITLPDASVTLASGTMLATDGDGSSLTGLTAGQIPNLAASKITSGTIDTARLGSGTASSSVFLAGDSSWVAPTSYDASPCFWAAQTSNQSCSGSATTTVTGYTETFDTDCAFNASTGVFTVPAGEGGTYQFNFGSTFTNTFSTDDRIMIKLLFNGGTGSPGNKALFQQIMLSGVYAYMGNLSAALPLDAADTVAMAVENFETTTTTEAGHTYFAGFKLTATNS